jgi:hypothetical protein
MTEINNIIKIINEKINKKNLTKNISKSIKKITIKPISKTKISESLMLLILLIANDKLLYFEKEQDYIDIMEEIIKENEELKSKEFIQNLPNIINIIINNISKYQKKNINIKNNNLHIENDILDKLLILFNKYQELNFNKIDIYELKKNIYNELLEKKLLNKINNIDKELNLHKNINNLIKDIYNHLDNLKNENNNNKSILSFFTKELKSSIKSIKSTTRLLTQKLNKNINKIELNNLKDTIELLIIVISYNKGIDINENNLKEVLENIDLEKYSLLKKKLPNIIKNIIFITNVNNEKKKKIESIYRKFLNKENLNLKYDEYDFLIYIFSYYRDIWLSDKGLYILKNELLKINNKLINNKLINNKLINNKLINNKLINNELINNKLINNELINNKLINNELINNELINNELINKKNLSKNVLNHNNKPIKQSPKIIPSKKLKKPYKLNTKINIKINELNILKNYVKLLKKEKNLTNKTKNNLIKEIFNNKSINALKKYNINFSKILNKNYINSTSKQNNIEKMKEYYNNHIKTIKKAYNLGIELNNNNNKLSNMNKHNKLRKKLLLKKIKEKNNNN